ncbi:MAG: helix-turn-helix transcriptional regulator [Kiritimatiellae bacterium]|nr:helix-turn-helix transcriptional regulator [Kiritimatiellia bacterium]
MKRGEPTDPADLSLPRVRIHVVGCLRLRDWTHATPLRTHWRMVWNRDAGSSVFHAGQRYRLTPGHMVLIPPETPITRELTRPARHLYLHFSAGQPYDRLAGEVFRFPLDRRLRSRLLELAGALEARGRFGTECRHALLLNDLVADILLRIPPERWARFREQRPITRTIRHMEENLARPVSNRELAGGLRMGESAFIRAFRAQVGLSPQAFWQDLRLRHAAILLLHSGTDIEGIAAECGFCDRYYLSKLFKRRYGVGPAAYRRAAGQVGSGPA